MTEPTPAQIEAAIEWLLYFHDQATQTDNNNNSQNNPEFIRWLNESEAHQIAWQRLNDLEKNRQHTQPAAAAHALHTMHTLEQNPQQLYRQARHYFADWTKQHKGLSLTLISIGLAASLGWQTNWWQAQLADYHSGTGEVKTATLPDGSRLTLAGNTAVNLAYSPNNRTIILKQGTIQIDVAKNPQRPFIVQTHQGSVEALGTRFAVQQTPEQTQVIVSASSVRACTGTTGQATHCARLYPNQTLHFNGQHLSTIHPINAEAATAWTNHQLVIEDQPVSAVLAQIDANYSGWLHYDTKAMAHYRISGVFPLNDPQQALETISATYPLNIKHPLPGVFWVSIR